MWMLYVIQHQLAQQELLLKWTHVNTKLGLLQPDVHLVMVTVSIIRILTWNLFEFRNYSPENHPCSECAPNMCQFPEREKCDYYVSKYGNWGVFTWILHYITQTKVVLMIYTTRFLLHTRYQWCDWLKPFWIRFLELPKPRFGAAKGSLPSGKNWLCERQNG